MRNLTMMTDLYQLTMMYGYFKKGMGQNRAIFDLFYRRREDQFTYYAIAAGLEQVIEYIEELRFDEEDIAYLRTLKLFDEPFFDYLSSFRFTGDICSVPEGTVVFPGEPILRVSAPLIEAQLIETAVLNILNHQTLIATKASRVAYAAQGTSVLEFGLRRAQGPDAGIYGARAAIIGGCQATSNVLTGKMYDVPVRGTHAHSWVMSFPDEISAFRAYAELFPSTCLLLVDTYDTLKSGVPNAIKVFEELRDKGYAPLGIRLDSGDMAYLSREARRMLDEAGFEGPKIFASGDLDEYLIWDMRAQGAKIDVWGVGTRMITSEGNAALGGVYKLVAEELEGKLEPRIKISENPAKITNPGYKQFYRFYDKQTDMAIADLITLDDEVINEDEPLTIFDPENVWKNMTLTNFRARKMLEPIFQKGKCVYQSPDIQTIQAYCEKELASFWSQYRRLTNPHKYKVDLSQALYDMKMDMLRKSRLS